MISPFHYDALLITCTDEPYERQDAINKAESFLKLC